MQYNGSYGYSQESILLNVDSISQVTDQLTSIKNKLMNINSEYRSAVNHYSIVSSSISTNSVSSQLDNAIYLSEKITSNLVSYISIAESLDRGFTYQGSNEKSIIGLKEISRVQKTLSQVSSLYESYDLLTSKNGLKFKFSGVFLNSDTKLILDNKAIANNLEYLNLRNSMQLDLGGRWKWNKSLLGELTTDGIDVFNSSGELTSNINKFKNSDFKDLGNAIKDFNVPINQKNYLSGFKADFIDELNIKKQLDFTDFSNMKNSQKASKALGVLGLGLTVVSNGVDNFYQDGKWNFDGESTEEFVLETGVDLVVDASVTALGAQIGAAAGSVFVPPIGTVIGTVAGIGISYVLNYKHGDPPMSIIDHTKSFVTDGVDKLQESCGKVVDSIGEGLSDAKEAIGGFVSDLFW